MTKTRKTTTPPTYRVYVIELASEACPVQERHRYRGFLYVGQTAHSAEKRFGQHLAGEKASKIVNRHGRLLRPDLYEGLPQLEDRAAALELEAATAARLREAGYFVHSA